MPEHTSLRQTERASIHPCWPCPSSLGWECGSCSLFHLMLLCLLRWCVSTHSPRCCAATQAWTTWLRQLTLSSRTQPTSTRCSQTSTVLTSTMSRSAFPALSDLFKWDEQSPETVRSVLRSKHPGFASVKTVSCCACSRISRWLCCNRTLWSSGPAGWAVLSHRCWSPMSTTPSPCRKLPRSFCSTGPSTGESKGRCSIKGCR